MAEDPFKVARRLSSAEGRLQQATKCRWRRPGPGRQSMGLKLIGSRRESYTHYITTHKLGLRGKNDGRDGIRRPAPVEAHVVIAHVEALGQAVRHVRAHEPELAEA